MKIILFSFKFSTTNWETKSNNKDGTVYARYVSNQFIRALTLEITVTFLKMLNFEL